MPYKLLFLLAVFVGLMAVLPVPAEAAFNPFEDACSNAANNPACGDVAKGQTGDNPVARIIRRVAFVVSFIVGAAAIIVCILGGFRYVTSMGDPQRAAQGKDMIIYSVIGLVVTALAGAIVFFVTDRFLV